MFRTPDVYGYFTANWQIAKPLKAIVTGTFTGPMTVQHMEGSGTDIDLAVRTESFFDASAKLVYCFNIFRQVDIDVTAGVSNIFNSYQRDFDSGPRRDSGYIYGPSLPAASPPEFQSVYDLLTVSKSITCSLCKSITIHLGFRYNIFFSYSTPTYRRVTKKTEK